MRKSAQHQLGCEWSHMILPFDQTYIGNRFSETDVSGVRAAERN